MRFIGIDNLEEKSSIVPTHVGVNRTFWTNKRALSYCPHACGGEPRNWNDNFVDCKLSPRMWG